MKWSRINFDNKYFEYAYKFTIFERKTLKKYLYAFIFEFCLLLYNNNGKVIMVSYLAYF